MPGQILRDDFSQGESSMFDQGKVSNRAYSMAFEKLSNLNLENGILTRRLGTKGLLASGVQPGLERFVPGAGPLAFDGGFLYSQNGTTALQTWLTSLLTHILYSYTLPNALSDTWICTDEGSDPANRRLLFFPALSQPGSRPGAGALPDVKLKTYYPATYQGVVVQPTIWSAATAYVPGNKVWLTAGGTVYNCILANTNQTPPNGTYWTASSYDSGWAVPTYDTSGNNEVGGDVIFSFMGRLWTCNAVTGAIRASRTQIYQEYGKFSGSNYATAGDNTTTPSYLQKLDGMTVFAPIPPFYMDDPATPSINEATYGQVQLSADLGIQLLGRSGSTPEYGPVLWMSGTQEFFFGTPKGIYSIQSGFVYGPSPELGGCTPRLIAPVPTMQATQIKTPGTPGTTQTLALWADTPNTVCFLSAADEITIFDKVTKRFSKSTLGLPRSLSVDTIAWYGSNKYAVLVVDLSGQSTGDFRNNYILIVDENTGARTRFDGIGYSPISGLSSSPGVGPNPTDGIYTIRGCGGAGIFVKLRSAGMRRAVFLPYAGAKKYSQASAIATADYTDFFHTTDVTGVIPIPRIRPFPVNQITMDKPTPGSDLGAYVAPTQARLRTYDTPSVTGSLVMTLEDGTEQITVGQTETDAGWSNGNPYVHNVDVQLAPAAGQVIRPEISCLTGQPFNVLAMLILTEANR